VVTVRQPNSKILHRFTFSGTAQAQLVGTGVLRETSAASGEFAIERVPPSWCEPRYRTELLRGMIKLDECLVDIAPAPTLWWVVTLDDRVSACPKMVGGVLAGRLVATTDVAT
jgi:hypothetical protein